MCAVPGSTELPWGAAAAAITLTGLLGAHHVGADQVAILVLHQRVGCEGQRQGQQEACTKARDGKRGQVKSGQSGTSCRHGPAAATGACCALGARMHAYSAVAATTAARHAAHLTGRAPQ